MKNKTLILILKALAIAFILFFTKHFIQAFIEYANVIPVKPKAYILGITDRAKYIFVWQFLFTFWVYILVVILSYFVLKVKPLKKMKIWKITTILTVIIFLFLLFVHQFEFPIEKTYFPSGEQINFGFIEELIIYSIVGFLLIYLVRKWLIPFNS